MTPEKLTAFAAIIIAFTGLVTALGVIVVKLNQVHKLVNSQYGDLLSVGLVSAKALYYKDPISDNKRLLDIAQHKFDEHVAKQALVDARK